MRSITVLLPMNAKLACGCCRGLVVVGSPTTLSSDPVWRSWIRWVRDHGAFLTANGLPLCPWESPDDEFVSKVDVSDLRAYAAADPGKKDPSTILLLMQHGFCLDSCHDYELGSSCFECSWPAHPDAQCSMRAMGGQCSLVRGCNIVV